jgi:murein DD-endopeptidase MepM/ murein hydrolase activator NlpD
MKISRVYTGFALLLIFLAACQPQNTGEVNNFAPTEQPVSLETQPNADQAIPTSSRPIYEPGEQVDYQAQSGDNLPALAAHFNTTVDEILKANSFIPPAATTLPVGMPMKIPIYYMPFWGSTYQIIPDSLFINGPAQVGFNTEEFVSNYPGWLNQYTGYASDETRSGAQIIDLVAQNFSVSPRLLLSLLEYQSHALTDSQTPVNVNEYILGYEDWQKEGLYLQLVWAANTLNNGYYGWRTGDLRLIEHLDGKVERPDPWQNATSVALQYYYSRILDGENYQLAISADGLAKTYQTLFGNPWEATQSHIPGSLEQPALTLPFAPGLTWAYTGGPHTAWGDDIPLSALDFAPGLERSGCVSTEVWATAMADGVVARSEPALVILDLDGDGDERTGWTIYYFHVSAEGQVQKGAVLKKGDPIGHPSCEGGRATGTHIHIARRYNGEWISASGVLAFNLEGWIAYAGAAPYLGTLKRNTRVVTACTCSDKNSQLESESK